MSVKPMKAQLFTAPARGRGWPAYPRRAWERRREEFEDFADQSTGLKPALEQDGKPFLGKMIIVRQDLADTLLPHHFHRDAVGQALL